MRQLFGRKGQSNRQRDDGDKIPDKDHQWGNVRHGEKDGYERKWDRHQVLGGQQDLSLFLESCNGTVAIPTRKRSGHGNTGRGPRGSGVPGAVEELLDMTGDVF